MPQFETGEAWLIGGEDESEQAKCLSSFLEDFFDFCSERLASLMNSGPGKKIRFVTIYIKAKK